MILRRRRRLKSEAGAELIEMALTLPLLLFALMAIVGLLLINDRKSCTTRPAKVRAFRVTRPHRQLKSRLASWTT